MNEDSRRRLENLLDREIELAESLAGVLGDERAALTGASAEALTRQAAEKTRLLTAIEQLEHERRALAAAAEQSLPGAQFAGGSAIAETVAQRWRTLMELMAGCRSANEVNGYIIHTRQGQIRQLIDIVRGSAPLTYTPQGKTLARALRALAKA